MDVVERDPRQAVARRRGGGLPDGLGEADPVADPTPAVRLDVADHQDHHGVVGEQRSEPLEDVAHEAQVGGLVVGVIKGRVDRRRVEAQEPGPQPVVVAVLDHAQVGRRGDHQPGAIGQATRSKGRLGPDACVARVAKEGDPADGRERFPVEPAELRLETAEDVSFG